MVCSNEENAVRKTVAKKAESIQQTATRRVALRHAAAREAKIQNCKLHLDVPLMREGIQLSEKQSILNKLLLELLVPLLDLLPLHLAKPKIKLAIGDKVMQVISDDLGKHVKPPKQTI
jgi:alanine racemase